MNLASQSDMASAGSRNNDFIPRAPLNRHNSSLMDVIGIGNKTNNNSSTNLAMNNFTVVTDPLTATTTSRLMNVGGIQRMDSPFQPDLTLNPPLQRTTSIFNDTSTITPTTTNTDLNDFLNPLSPSTSNAVSTIAPISSTIQNMATSNVSTFTPNGVPMAPPGLINLYVSQWKYVDYQDEQQGPFPSTMMSQWYHNNYFQLNLQLLIVDPNNNNNNTNSNTNNQDTSKTLTIDPLQIHNKFITLNELILKVGNAIDPFATYDSIINSLLRNVNGNSININSLFPPPQQQQLQQQSLPSISATKIAPTNSNTSSNQLFTASSYINPTTVDDINAFSTDKVLNRHVPNNNNPINVGDWSNVDNKNEKNTHVNNFDPGTTMKEDGIVANIHSGDYTFDEIMNLPLPDNAYYHQVLVPVPMQRQLKKKIDPQIVIKPSDDPRFTDIWAIKEIVVGYPKLLNDSNKVEKDLKNEPVVDETSTLETKVITTTIPHSGEIEDKFTGLSISNTIESQEDHKVTNKTKKTKKCERSDKNEKGVSVSQDEQKINVDKKDLTLEEKRKIKAELMAKQLIEEEEARVKQQEIKSSKKSKKQKEKKSKTKKNGSESASHVGQKEESNKTAEEANQLIPDEASSSQQPISKPAPWANKGRSKNKGISLTSFFELQRNEEIKQQKIEEQKKLEAMRLSAQILKEEQEKERNKAMLTWANTNTSTNIIATVDIKGELLKDQEQKKKAKKESLQQNQLKSFGNIPNDPAFIEEQQRIWEQLRKASKTQKANNSSINQTITTPTTAVSNTNAWTKVTSKTKKTTVPASNVSVKPQPVNKPTKQIGSSTSIPALKNKFVSNIGTISPATVTTRTATPMYPGNSSISKRQEFLKWCRSQLKLNPGISSNSVLEVLLSLPAGAESNEIIADTIYSNSAVMDGRRFAVEFNKKRIECEKQVTDPLSWSEALALPEGNDDDWEFQVVSKKKKGKRH
ncbi:Smy2p PWA37_000033 [Arxiozyma heterogenica]|uniref:Smy2p n=1 Tax=Arxiozyma heterogenica TaxID=278026 RepID=UPI002F1FBA67